MFVPAELKSDAAHMDLLHVLLVERGIDRYGLFLLTSENLFSPNGYEEMSGIVVSGDGRCFFFWTSWDDASQLVIFETWNEVEPRAEWQSSQEYHAARAAAGLV